MSFIRHYFIKSLKREINEKIITSINDRLTILSYADTKGTRREKHEVNKKEIDVDAKKTEVKNEREVQASEKAEDLTFQIEEEKKN